MRAEIIAVGTEILLGDIANTDAQMISKELALMGINVYYHTVVGDNKDRLRDALEHAKKRADIIITTGGLGPTYDDLTKEIIAETFGKKLVLDEKALEDIEKFFVQLGREMTENNKKQAYLPEDCVVFYNNWGTAPGCGFKSGNNHVLMLPGPPRECDPMMRYCAVPYLKSLSDGVIHSVALKIFGKGESEVEEILKDMMTTHTNPTIAPYAKQSECFVRITAKAQDEKTAKDLILPIKNDVYSILGEYIYGEDDQTLEEVLVSKLLEKELTISTAESCTGGLVSKRITDISGCSKVFKGSVCAYSNEVKESILGVSAETLEKYGAVSSQTAREMAKGVAELLKTDIAISTTGVAGPNGGTDEKPVGLVHICVYYKGEYYDLKIMGTRDRDSIRQKAVSCAIDLVIKILKR